MLNYALAAAAHNVFPRSFANPAAKEAAVRPVRRERDFGVGYGNSSGYASGKRYVRPASVQRFRVV